MDSEERIQSHLVSVWRESKRFPRVGGREGMLILTDKHLSFIHKTEAKLKWWQAVVQRQVLGFLRDKNTMTIHDGYNETDLATDLENEKNIEITFDQIKHISFEEKTWGSVLSLEYENAGKLEKYQFSIAQDWVRYPAKEPTKYMKVDWTPFVQYIRKKMVK